MRTFTLDACMATAACMYSQPATFCLKQGGSHTRLSGAGRLKGQHYKQLQEQTRLQLQLWIAASWLLFMLYNAGNVCIFRLLFSLASSCHLDQWQLAAYLEWNKSLNGWAVSQGMAGSADLVQILPMSPYQHCFPCFGTAQPWTHGSIWYVPCQLPFNMARHARLGAKQQSAGACIYALYSRPERSCQGQLAATLQQRLQ